ncbi:MAG: hypothetical protein S4CHLAM37_07930 [Chlamydiia bacterium]|nr:hypothetical protein [Chlamydiia bacterium]
MFEFFIAKKYLVPKKKQLSVSLIALMSVAVISLVVWLVLIFLSVTEGIEKNWLTKLTSLNAPVRVLPSNTYYNSYYYRVDEISSSSDYTSKSLGEKLNAELTDPYDPEVDEEVPELWPNLETKSNGKPLDPVKEAFACINELKKEYPKLVAHDYEIAGALMKLKLIRPMSAQITSTGDEKQSYLTQMSYVATFSENSPYMHNLLIPPTKADVEHLLYLSSLTSFQDGSLRTSSEDLTQNRLKQLFSHIKINKLESRAHHFRILKDYLKEKDSLQVAAFRKNGAYGHFLVPNSISKEFTKSTKESSNILEYGKVVKEDGHLVYYPNGSKKSFIIDDYDLFVENKLEIDAKLTEGSLEEANFLSDLNFDIETSIQNLQLKGVATFKDLDISSIDIKNHFEKAPASPPLWPYYSNGACMLPYLNGTDNAAILPKNYKDAGVRIGDKGFLSYSVATANAMQEQRLPIFVTGFYDPGIMSVGARCILMKDDIVHHIAKASNSFLTDPLMSSGIQIWFEDLGKTKEVHEKLVRLFKERGIDKYFTVKNFHQYEFAKDLMQQFQSDKYLFTLIGIIILIVACSNIISFLVIMVNDKKKEIGIMQSMGASRKSIAIIFAVCGVTLGLLGSTIGTLAAYLTMHNIDSVVNLLSMLQGHQAFHESFYGSSLPTKLSSEAVTFILITTPIVSVLAGLIPAIKACGVKPANTLRSE